MTKVMRYCKKCVQPDTRPGIHFTNDGICFACKYEEEKLSIDWGKRLTELRDIAEWAKRNNNGSYDCIIGVSGGKDSTFQAMYARDELGLNPLLVNAVPECITEAGKHNIDNLAKLGFDIFMIRPNPNIMKKLIKRDFYKYCNPQKVTEYTLWASAYQVAINNKIPLIIQGENAGLTLGVIDGLGTDNDAANVFMSNTLAGGDAFKEYGNTVDKKHLFQYQFPERKLLDKSNIKAIYLQYYVIDWGWRHNGEFAHKHGLMGREYNIPEETGRYSKFGNVDSDMNIYNQMLKYYKFGFGFVTDEASYDIRDGHITREQGIELVKKYDGKCTEKYIIGFCDYIEISIAEFWKVVDKFVNKDLFEKDDKTGRYKPKFIVGEDYIVK